MNAATLVAVRVWDLPTRLFHGLLAGCVIGAIVSAKIGGTAMDWHLRFGLAVLALLAFRLLWGLVGGRWSRFASFVPSIGALARNWRGASRPGDRHAVGHGPLGALSVLAMLAALAAQVATGLIADDEIASRGPLAARVSAATSSLASGWHTGPGQGLVIGLSVLHVGAIAVYRRRGLDLVGPMLHGDKPLPPDTPASADGLRMRLLALLLATLCVAGAAAIAGAGARPFAVDLVVPDLPELLDTLREVLRDYARSLGEDVLCFQGFDAELAGLPGDYAPPAGALLLALVDGEPAGCGAMRPLHDVDHPNACEMKRLYVRPAFRRFGLGRLIAEALMDEARRCGHSTMLLDTLDDMEAARGLYTSLGFEETAPYYFNPIPGAHYLKVDLDDTSSRY